MKNGTSVIFALIGLSLLLHVSCIHKNTYHLSIVHIKPDGKEELEKESIYANNDTLAYVQAATTFFLARYAYKRVEYKGKGYLKKPVRYKLVDAENNDIDSVLGKKVTDSIRQRVERIIN